MNILKPILLALCLCTPAQAEIVHEVNLVIKFVDSLSDIPTQEYNRYGMPRYIGYAQPRPDKCTIYVLEPYNWEDHIKVEAVGHETLHCVWGPHKPKLIRR